MKKIILLLTIVTLALFTKAQEANFSGITDGQQICIDAGTIIITADNNTTGIFDGTGITDNANGTATFDPVTAGAGSHSISYQVNVAEFVQIAGGWGHSLGIKSDGTLWAWGDNLYGQLGDSTSTDRHSPVQIGTANNWSQIAGGGHHSLGIKSDGTLWAWGRNIEGNLGDGTTTNRTSPVQIGTATNWSQIAAFNHSLGIKSDGTLWAWGDNSSGQLGNGTTTNRTSPVQIGTATNWSQIDAGRFHSLGIISDGTLWAWGWNYSGRLGDGTTTDRLSPVQIGTATDWSQIAASEHSLGIKSDGTLWAWGYNWYGQLGDGTATDRHSPVQIDTVTNWSQIAGGYYHSLGIKSDSTLWAWGKDLYGQSGDGNATHSNSPVKIHGPTVTSTKTVSVNNPTTGTDVQNACDSYTWIDGITYTASNNTATFNLTNAAGCDSLVTLNLNINATPNNGVSQAGNTLTADENGATYQWLDCDSGNAPISEANAQSYTASASGNYAVEITKDGCTNTSSCISLTIVGIENLTTIPLSVYPNPTADNLTLQVDNYKNENLSYQLYDMQGKLLSNEPIVAQQTQIIMDMLPSATYFVHIVNQENKRILSFKIIKY
jgi:alpha-tubulin suppressor-like RCC1 family protein